MDEAIHVRPPILLLAACVMLIPAHALAQATAVSPPAWLTGCWERRAGDRLVEEHWMAPRGGMMLGVGPLADVVTFENLAHDFPQRVIYRRAGADSLIARVEGTRAGQPRGFDFPYRRVACAGSGHARQ